MAYLRILMLLAVVALVGCQANESQKVDVQTQPAAEAAKAALNEVAESGQLGSGMMTVRESVEKANPELLPEVDALEALTDEAAIKAKAKEIADKL